VSRLAIAGLIGFCANFFRYGADIWFVDYKWGESLGYLFFALANVWAIWPLLTFGKPTEPVSLQSKK
jgi:protein-S-isoprenylcysteine O-methyltransferase Ste14